MSKKKLILAGILCGVAAIFAWRLQSGFAPAQLAQRSIFPLTGTPLIENGQGSPSDQGLAVRKLTPEDESVQTLLESTDYYRRIQVAVTELPAKLGAKNYAALAAYLRTPQDGPDGDFRQHEYALRNYIMDALRADSGHLSEALSVFADVATDERQGDVMRGYALQHLCSIYLDPFQQLSTDDKQRILQTFTVALSDTSSAETLAGTALTGLHEVARADPNALPSSVVELSALKLLQSPESGTLSKISAFQICGERKVGGMRELARQTALGSSADRVLRMSAVYALGQLGQTDGLESLVNDPDPNVGRAAQMALNIPR